MTAARSPVGSRRTDNACEIAALRRGFALPAAIMALVVIAALIAATLVVSAEELRAGRTDVAAQRALASAEVALDRAIATWDARLNVSARVGETRLLASSSIRSAGGHTVAESVVVTATRVRERAFWLTARATSNADGRPIPARVTIAATTRLLAPTVPVAAALTVGGAATIAGGTVDGRGAGSGGCPDGATDGPDAPGDAAGVIARDTSRVCGIDCADGLPLGVQGTPPVASDAGLTTDSATLVSVVAALGARATVVAPGGELVPRPLEADGECARAERTNWGDPSGGSCADYYPVIRITGDATLMAGSIGQGILLVAGSLTVRAGARFDGVVIATNDVHVVGPGAELRGVVIAMDGGAGDGSSVRDGGAIRFSGCAARRARLGAGRLTRTPDRWWAELR